MPNIDKKKHTLSADISHLQWLILPPIIKSAANSIGNQDKLRVIRMTKFIIFILSMLPCFIYANNGSQYYHPQILAGFDADYLFSRHEAIFLMRHLIAVGMGALIGLSHKKQRHFECNVSLRTFAAVTLGACTFASISCHLFLVSGENGNSLQMIGPIVSGIGFLCAAVIFKEGVTVQGLSTAASLWTAATIGTACGIGLYGVASITTILMIGLHRLKSSQDVNKNIIDKP